VIRHEAVAQHQVSRDAAKQFVIDAELCKIDELQPVALGELLRARRFRHVLRVGGLGKTDVELAFCRMPVDRRR
jgi:hypothetical protein